MDYTQITKDIHQALEELLELAALKEGQILVVGCSTSEVSGHKIGTSYSLEVAEALLKGILPQLQKARIFLAVQCCEHLNRALVVERACQERYGLEEVSVYPIQEAGGSMAYQAMQILTDPVVVEKIQAHAGMDIGDTFIGMHLKPVVVPVRVSIKSIGAAHLTMARTRPKLIGGERASYQCQ
ncbi:MAG: TIGR01440 family protein [Peptococcia bacterium]